MSKIRCSWVGKSVLEIEYHDQEWCLPCDNDQQLFQIMTLEGAQAGLSWSTILKKREGYRQAFSDFDPVAVAQMSQQDVARLILNPAIVRHKLKIESTISNAVAFLKIQDREGSFARFLWGFVDCQPINNQWQSLDQVPANTPIAEKLSKELKRRGFRFVGPTICYAMMQAAGLVNDHTFDCFRNQQIANLNYKFDR